ncbi:MAG: hypothetical protein CFE41_15590 [Burkholderiales bacterium PBB2]|nr:MAG: hypothetical protein CFE41_15590 [Burkholderiales bacterium PBB2]
MKSFAKFTLALSLVLALVAAVSGVWLWQEMWSHPGVSISINGEDLYLGEMASGQWAELLVGGLITGMVLLFVLPLVLLLGVGLPLLIVGGVLVCVVGTVLAALFSVGAVLGSPLILLGLVLWLLLRDRRPKRRAQA